MFFVFLPPILWSAAYFTSLREFTSPTPLDQHPRGGAGARDRVAVAVAARALLPGMPWAAALALGAIVSPPDAIAAEAIISRLPVPRRIITVLGGESLVNDASALMLYRTAVVAAVTGYFSPGESIVRFFIDAGIGILVGLFVGWLMLRAARWTSDALAEVLIGLLGPYVAWVAGRVAARLGGARLRGRRTLRAPALLDRRGTDDPDPDARGLESVHLSPERGDLHHSRRPVRRADGGDSPTARWPASPSPGWP